MFKLLNETAEQVVVTLDDVEVSVPADVSVAAALLYLDQIPTRHTPVSGTARAPFCMMGVCFECLVDIDGHPNRQACLTHVTDGMRVEVQTGNGNWSADQ